MMMCEICGKKLATDTHHLVFGFGIRELADEDGITIELCRTCHDTIHNNGVASTLSKMLGQTIWESKFGSREDFMKRYGRSWL